LNGTDLGEIIRVTFALAAGDGSEEAFRKLAHGISTRRPRTEVRWEAGAGASSVAVDLPEGRKLRWEMVPDQAMEAPFFAFWDPGREALDLDGPTKGVLADLPRPPQLVIYGARWCAASAEMVRLASRCLLARPGTGVTVVDVERLSRDGIPPGIEAVPVTFIGAEARLYGSLSEAELAAGLAAWSRNLGPDYTLAQMLKQKKQREALALLRARVLPVSALARAAGDPLHFELRLGALVLLSEVGRLDRALAAEATPWLCARLGDPSAHIRGDVLLALAEVGDLRALPSVESLLYDADADVREAAVEAAERIRRSNLWGRY
jgi:hypothetical protein